MSSRWPTKPLGELLSFLTSGSRGWAEYYRDSGDLFLRIQNVGRNRMLLDDVAFVAAPDTAEARRTLVQPGDVLLSITADLGRTGVVPDGLGRAFINQHLAILRVHGIHPHFLSAFLASPEGQKQVMGRNKQGVKAGLNFDDIRSFQIPIPPLAEQRRIAEVLERAEALRSTRRVVLAELDSLTHSIFLDLFGDPATNPKGWPSRPVGSLASKFSDGPFGSNLKSEHYVEAGVRVVRLQNIGVGAFLADDAAFISQRHFERLKKHECRPGDVLVGTMGDPNLRACIQPEWLTIALNKADCVQLRPDERLANATYITALLNQPSTERMAHDLMHGQTRVRISMGRLRGLEVPVPPIELQREFARRVQSVEKLKAAHLESSVELDTLFISIQHSAFLATPLAPADVSGLREASAVPAPMTVNAASSSSQ